MVKISTYRLSGHIGKEYVIMKRSTLHAISIVMLLLLIVANKFIHVNSTIAAVWIILALIVFAVGFIKGRL